MTKKKNFISFFFTENFFHSFLSVDLNLLCWLSQQTWDYVGEINFAKQGKKKKKSENFSVNLLT